MGKIRVKDLAEMMGLAEQDLIFKLKSIGVRLDDEHPMIDKEVIEAVLQGKSLRHPREVILRDKEAQATAPVQRKRPPTRRAPIGQRRPPRRRPIIQRVEPRIKTIPTTETPKPASPVTPTTTPEAPGTRPAMPAQAKTPADTRPRQDKPRKTVKKPVATGPRDEDLRSYKGSAAEIAEAADRADEARPPVSARQRRRAERKERQSQKGKGLEFRDAAPEGVITVSEGMTLRAFAEKLGVKSKDLIKTLFNRGVMATINQVIEPKLAVEMAAEMGVEAMIVSFEEEVQRHEELHEDRESTEGVPRDPVVTIMGHVDHGKTTLLDSIRSSKVTESEFGGITQHIGAYQVDTESGKVVFLDTPGHEAFTTMRARGAKVTDIVVLVVAADDGVMPQTIEAIDHARAADVPIIVAINKIDKSNSNPDRVKKELADHELAVEEWGGDTVSVAMSAIKNEGVSELLELIRLTADLLELKADPTLAARGAVIEARKEPGRGVVATILVQDGTLRVGDVFVSGATWGRVRSMSGDQIGRVEEAGPATPVEVTGLGDVPEAGDLFQVVADEAKARGIAEFRKQERRARQLSPEPTKLSLERLFTQIQEGGVKELPIVVKADVQGSVEVVTDTLRKLSTSKVEIQIIRSGVGAITNKDIILASASNAIVVGFNVRPEKKATDLANEEQVDIRLHTVIYELNDEIKKAMTGLLDPTFKEVTKGRAEVREIFSIPRHGTVAGCHVVEGVVPRNGKARLLRDNVVVHQGAIGSLRRFKEDVAEVRTGFDCGIRLERFQDVKPGDTIEVFVKEEVAATL